MNCLQLIFCYPNLCKKWQLILKNDLFSHTRTWWPKSMKSKNCPKFFHRVIFAFWIQICNPNLCKSHIFWITGNIEKMTFFCIPGPDDQNRWNRKNCPKVFHRVIFALSEFKSATQIYINPIHFELQLILRNWPFFAYPDLMTKIDEIEKIARNSFIG